MGVTATVPDFISGGRSYNVTSMSGLKSMFMALVSIALGVIALVAVWTAAKPTGESAGKRVRETVTGGTDWGRF